MYPDKTFSFVDTQVYRFLVSILETHSRGVSSHGIIAKTLIENLRLRGFSGLDIGGSLNFLIRKGILNMQVVEDKIYFQFVE